MKRALITVFCYAVSGTFWLLLGLSWLAGGAP